MAKQCVVFVWVRDECLPDTPLLLLSPAALSLPLQPNTQRVLDAGDVGTVNRTHELRVYWVSVAGAFGCRCCLEQQPSRQVHEGTTWECSSAAAGTEGGTVSLT